MKMRTRNRLTQVLEALDREARRRDLGHRFAFKEGRYTIRVANDRVTRERAYKLIYGLYLEKEYAAPSNASRMWLSLHDALPETTTLVVERADGVMVGALTVVFDSPMGLPSDELYAVEMAALRAQGRRLGEVVSLGVSEGIEGGRAVLVKLFNFAYFVARGIRGATDFTITVNPRHVRFYKRLMRFEEVGPERECKKVGGAPAVLLRLDFAVGEADCAAAEPGVSGEVRSIYGQFCAASEAPEAIAGLRCSLRAMSEDDLRYFFVEKTDLLAEAWPKDRHAIEDAYPSCDWGRILAPEKVFVEGPAFEMSGMSPLRATPMTNQ